MNRSIEHYGREHCLAATLTVPGRPTPDEVMDNWSSLTKKCLPHCDLAYGVLGRSRTGRYHLHALLAVPEDVASGINTECLARISTIKGAARNERRALTEAERSEVRRVSGVLGWNPDLKAARRWFRKLAGKAGFGKLEMDPIWADDNRAYCRYCGSNYAGAEATRPESAKGVRFHRFVGTLPEHAKVSARDFSLVGGQSARYRQTLSVMAQDLGIEVGDGRAMERIYGPRWSYHGVLQMQSRLGGVGRSLRLV